MLVRISEDNLVYEHCAHSVKNAFCDYCVVDKNKHITYFQGETPLHYLPLFFPFYFMQSNMGHREENEKPWIRIYSGIILSFRTFSLTSSAHVEVGHLPSTSSFLLSLLHQDILFLTHTHKSMPHVP